MKFLYIKNKMVVDDIQQKSQEGYKGGLDEILKFGDSLSEAKMEYHEKIVRYLSLAVANYIFNGMVKAPRVSVNENGESYRYSDGITSSQRPIHRSVGKDSFGEVAGFVYKFGGVVFIKDDKLKLELVRGDALGKDTYGYGIVGVIEMKKEEYERQKMGLYYLRKLSKIDEMLPLAIWLLENELYEKGIGERKGIEMEYNMLTGDLKIKVCEDDIIKSPKGIEDTYTNMLYSSIHDYQGLTGRKYIELEGKKGRAGILLNTKYIIEKDIIEHEKPIIEKYIIEHKPNFLEKEKIPSVLDSMLSEETLKQRYKL